MNVNWSYVLTTLLSQVNYLNCLSGCVDLIVRYDAAQDYT